SPGYARCATESSQNESQNPARSSHCGRRAAFPASVHTPQPENRSRCRSDGNSKNRCQACRVCPYSSPQKLSFISARKCWKCSLIGIIFAIGCRSPFPGIGLACQAKPTYTLSLFTQSTLRHPRLPRRSCNSGQPVVKSFERQGRQMGRRCYFWAEALRRRALVERVQLVSNYA